MADETLAEANRRKLQEHLAKLQASGGKVAGKDTADNAKRQADPLQDIDSGRMPKGPPPPPGWEAWKQAHSGRVHTVTYKNAAEVAEEADYKLLGLTPPASKDEVRKAFNKLAKENHPDLGGDAEIFQAMQMAYKRLLKSAK